MTLLGFLLSRTMWSPTSDLVTFSLSLHIARCLLEALVFLLFIAIIIIIIVIIAYFFPFTPSVPTEEWFDCANASQISYKSLRLGKSCSFSSLLKPFPGWVPGLSVP